MAKEVFINTKDLPKLDEIKGGDYLFAQTPDGLKIIDFDNLILPTGNTLVTATVEANTNSIITLSAETTASIKTLSSAISDVSDNNTYVGSVQIKIPTGNTSYIGILYPTITKSFTEKDVIVTPANSYASKFPAYVTGVQTNGQVTIQASFTRQVIVNSGNFNITLSGSLTTEKLSAYRSQEFVPTLSASPADVSEILSGLALSSVPIAAEEDAIYNVFVIKNASV